MNALRYALFVALTLPAALQAQSNTFPSTGNAGIGTTDPGNNKLQIVRDLGTNDYTNFGQHQMHLRIRRASDLKAVELGVLDNGVAVLQASEAGVGYHSLALNPVSGNVGIRTLAPGSPLHVYGPGNAALGTVRLESWNPFTSITSGQSDTVGEPEGFALIEASYNASDNHLTLGGGLDEFNAATVVSFRTAPGVTTRAGVERMRIDSSGNVGIGTISPVAKIDVRGYAAIADASGINTDSFPHRVVAGAISDGSGWGLSTAIGGNSGVGRSWAIGSNGGDLYMGYQNSVSGTTMQTFLQVSPNRNVFIVPVSGDVGIGTLTPSHKLTVNGTIRAKEVIVDTNWADYVFAEDYRLAPLSEVEAHIKEHNHLPDMPSAAEVAEKGVSMGEMQARMMAKIEELTLHVIRLEKELHTMKDENETLRASLKQ